MKITKFVAYLPCMCTEDNIMLIIITEFTVQFQLLSLVYHVMG